MYLSSFCPAYTYSEFSPGLIIEEVDPSKFFGFQDGNEWFISHYMLTKR